MGSRTWLIWSARSILRTWRSRTVHAVTVNSLAGSPPASFSRRAISHISSATSADAHTAESAGHFSWGSLSNTHHTVFAILNPPQQVSADPTQTAGRSRLRTSSTDDLTRRERR